VKRERVLGVMKAGYVLSVDPQSTLAQGHTVFAILPLDVSVSRLLEGSRTKTCCLCQFPHPFVDWYMNAVRRRIPNHEANAARGCADTTKG